LLTEIQDRVSSGLVWYRLRHRLGYDVAVLLAASEIDEAIAESAHVSVPPEVAAALVSLRAALTTTTQLEERLTDLEAAVQRVERG
jgi:hypothetical protein